jgi:hypothetical protein
VGVAAHIHAAAVGGARFDPSLSPEAIAAADNGIWLCANCAIEIDQHRGRDFPADLLRQWRADHHREARERIGRGTSGSTLGGAIAASGVGVVTGVEIVSKNVRIEPGTTVSATGIGRITGVKI